MARLVRARLRVRVRYVRVRVRVRVRIRVRVRCAAWPASCMRVVRPVRPEPIAAGSAREVKCVTVGCHEPSALSHAGCGQWQKPLEYLPLRSRRSRLIEAPGQGQGWV